MSCPQIIRLATRGSALALAQARRVAEKIAALAPSVRVELFPVRTTADRDPGKPLRAFGDKGVFVREVEEAVASGRADAAVHSLKDLPAVLPENFVLAAIPERVAPCDILIARNGRATLETLPPGTRVATSSLRRRGQLLHHRPDLQIVDIRGNVDTRLRKLAAGQADAIILAKAGLLRLNALPEHATELPIDAVLPAPCQGAIAVETMADSPLLSLLAQLDLPEARLACETERAFVRAIGADCRTPVGCLCAVGETSVQFSAVICSADGSRVVRFEKEVPLEAAADLAHEAAQAMLACGARAIIEKARSAPPSGGTS